MFDASMGLVQVSISLLNKVTVKAVVTANVSSIVRQRLDIKLAFSILLGLIDI
jgi:hypothetical protein